MARASVAHPATAGAHHRPVWVRLFVLVLVPWLGMAGALAPQVLRSAREATTARRLAHDIERLQGLIALRSAVTAEGIDGEALTRVSALHVSDPTVMRLIGDDVRSRHRSSMDRTAAALLLLDQQGPSALAGWVRSSLMAVRPQLPAATDAAAIRERLSAIRLAVGRAVDQSVAQVVSTTRFAPVPALATLELAVRFSRDGIGVVDSLSNVLLGPTAEEPQRRAALIGLAAVFEDSADELRSSSPDWARRVDDLLSDPRFGDLRTTVVRLSASTTPVSLTFDPMVAVLAADASLVGELDALTITAEQQSLEWVRRVADEAERQTRDLAVLAGTVVVATAAWAALSARALGRRLARRASDLSAGHLAEAATGGNDGRPVTVGASVGIAVASDPPADPSGLLGRTDDAVDGAKRAGRGRVEVQVVG